MTTQQRSQVLLKAEATLRKKPFEMDIYILVSWISSRTRMIEWQMATTRNKSLIEVSNVLRNGRVSCKTWNCKMYYRNWLVCRQMEAAIGEQRRKVRRSRGVGQTMDRDLENFEFPHLLAHNMITSRCYSQRLFLLIQHCSLPTVESNYNESPACSTEYIGVYVPYLIQSCELEQIFIASAPLFKAAWWEIMLFQTFKKTFHLSCPSW